jgi:proteic killer suppression protein
MIKSFGSSATRRFAMDGKSKFSALDDELALQRLGELDAANGLSDLGVNKSVGLHKLKGNLGDRWSVKINGPWRIVFRFDEGHAYDVEIVDYH